MRISGILTIIAFSVTFIGCADKQLPNYSTLPDFSFITAQEQPFGLNDMKDHITVVDFIFTQCRAACPVMSVAMLDLYNQLTNEPRVRFVSVSVDPEYDTPKVLREYSTNLGVKDDRWIFLRGEIAQVTSLSEQGFLLAAEDLPVGHSTKFVLVDQNGNVRGYYDALDTDQMPILVKDIYKLLRN